MTGDDVYHPRCFKCRSCHNLINGLVFARTSYGIYCMDCHNNRVARIRRRAQIQRERANIILDPFERSSFRGGHLDITGDRDGGREDLVANTASAHDVPVPEPKTPVERSAVLPSSTLPVSPGPELRPANITNVSRLSVSSVSSSSSFTSADSLSSPVSPPFPSGPSTYEELMGALRRTHNQYLSTIAAFIGHAHLHSRSSLAAGTGHINGCVKEIVKITCKLLAVVEAVLHHPTVPVHKAANLKSAKEGLYNVTSGLAEKNGFNPFRNRRTQGGGDCVAAVKMSLSRSSGEQPFIIERPGDLGEYSAPSHSADSAVRQDQRAVGLSEIQQGAEAWSTETTSQDLNTYSRVPGLKLRGKQSNYQRSRQNESSARQIDYSFSNSDDDVDADNDEEKDNFPEEFFDVETGSYNGPRSIKTASHAGSVLLVFARLGHVRLTGDDAQISKQSFSTWSIFSTDSSRTSKIFG
ncbi:hypothetical protein BC826DRAFT_1110631 [Russula brevipes]|nr:hypothetical protein BC826DRAFT_1110631 [Russula brevipes]